MTENPYPPRLLPGANRPAQHRPPQAAEVMVWLLTALLLFALACPQAAMAAKSVSWNTVAATQVTATPTNPIRNRRSNDASVSITVANVSGQALNGPFRLVIANLSPTAKVSIANATGTTSAGEPYFNLAGYVGTVFAPGATGLVNATVTGGGPNIFTYSLRVEQQVTTILPLSVNITSPATLLTVGSTPQTVQGTVSDPAAQVTVNGVPVTNNSGTFQASVNLDEGHNPIAVRALDAEGQDATDIISLSLDMTPPYLTVASPQDGDIVRIPKIAVSGLVNDIVRGTVAEGQAQVTVNGIAAGIANRSYLGENVPLNEGDNTLTIVGVDNVGNTSRLSLKVTYRPLAAQHIEVFSGQDQAAAINTALPQPLKARLLDGNSHPVANKPVIFRVTEGDGVVGAGSQYQGQGTLANTDAQGVAAVPFKLGSRAGTGNQRVRAAAVGFDGEALFYATATVSAADKVTVNSGNNQRGGVGQPLPEPFVVAVLDAGANAVAGAQVEFTITQGSGKFQNGQTSIISTTDSDGRATAELTLGPEQGLDAQRATATLAGTGLYAGFTASALVTGPAGQTAISGVVLDNQDQPLANVTLRVDGTTRETQTDAQGQFRITEAPVGAVRLVADGSTIGDSNEWSTLAFNLVTVAGADNPLPSPVYLVKLDTANAQQVGDKDVTLTLPDVPGFALEVKAGSVTFPDGKKTGKLSVTPVNASRIPMPPPNGMQPQFIVTIQPIGAKFDPPARLSLPNVDGHRPGKQVEMYSYDHDLEEFVAIGLGTVSTDGSVIKSNDGVGVIKAGWHCGSQPGGRGCSHDCGICTDCDGNCNCVPKDGDPRVSECKKCQKGKQVPDDTKTPKSISNIPNDCKKPGCKKGSAQQIPDTSDKPDVKASPDNECKTCDKNGNITPDATKESSKCDNNECKKCKNGKCEYKTEPNTTLTELSIVGPVSPSKPLAECDWGATYPESPIEININVRCDGEKYSAVIESMVAQYSQQVRLLPGQIEVTGPEGNTTKDNFCAQVTELKMLGNCPGGQWYMLKAVQDHEDYHLRAFLPALQNSSSDIEYLIESLSVPNSSGKTKNQALIEIQSSPAYIQALRDAQIAWEGRVIGQIFRDHQGATQEVEGMVVNPMIKKICDYSKAKEWGKCEACPL
jgi:hypothetical protein